MKGNKIIGMVRLRPGFEKDYEGRPPIYGVGCAGTIEEYEQLPDGRYVILLRGLTTFRIVSEDQRKPYRLARIEAVPELLKDEDRLALSTLRNRIEKLLVTLLPLGVDPPDASLEDDEFVNIVAQNFGMPEATRQELLERNNVIERSPRAGGSARQEVRSGYSRTRPEVHPPAMKRLFSLAIAVVIIVPAIAAAQDVAITNARIIVGSGQVIDSGTIIVKGGKIVLRRAPERRRRRVCAPLMRRA